MSKIAIVSDSTAYIPKDLREENEITMIPLNVIFGNESYQEEVDITAEDFYQQMKDTEDLPKTSQPAIGIFEEMFQQLAEDYEEVIVITLSSGISGTHQSALSAGNMVDSIVVHVFDSEVSCMVQGFYALSASKMAKEKYDAKAILDHLYEMKTHARAYFIADDLSHLHRGGRLNGAQLFVGSLLQIKPVLHFENKVIVPYEKVRTTSKAIKKILALLDEDARDGKPLEITVIHANRPEKAAEITAQLQEKYPNANVSMSYFGPVIGTHLGEGSLGIGWVKLAN